MHLQKCKPAFKACCWHGVIALGLSFGARALGQLPVAPPQEFEGQYGAPDLKELDRPDLDAPTRPTLPLVDDFTASTLAPGEVKIGTDVEFGLGGQSMLGTDIVAALFGVPSLKAKFLVHERGRHAISLGLRIAYADRETMLWGSVRDQFSELRARRLKAGISWTNSLSPRLRIHTYWTQGFGTIKVALSPLGKRKLYEAKHPGSSYDERNNPDAGEEPGEDPEQPRNQARATVNETDSFAQRTLQVSSITGIMSDTFQITGEFDRAGGNKILISSRIEKLEIEELRANNFRVTAAQQWVWETFQFRIGLGVQYMVISGRDLDGESIDQAGVLPASDINFYWRF